MTQNYESCRFHHPSLENMRVIHLCNKGDTLSGPFEETNAQICASCNRYKNRYIQFPIEINEIKPHPIEPTLYQNYIGKLCAVRPCRSDMDEKTYIGIFLGETVTEIHTIYHEDTKVLEQIPIYNPAILIPELNTIIHGYESWWHIIENDTELITITDDIIQNQWYMKFLTPKDES